jgi:hypothetical protein
MIFSGDSNTGIAWVFFSTLEITEEYEYSLYDFNSFVSAVGGSLGLFVGFSFLNLIQYISSTVQLKFQKS